MRKLSRRTFATSAGASLLFAPFLAQLRGEARAAVGKKSKRVLFFCTMGTAPQVWAPTGVSGENSFTFSEALSPLAAVKQHVVLIDGMPSANPGNGHGAPDGLSGTGYGKALSVDQFIGDKIKAAGINRPIPVLLLSADSNAGGGRSMFNRGENLATIASPVSAFNTVFGGAAPAPGDTGGVDKLLRRRKSILDLLKGEVNQLHTALGAQERAKLQLHLDSFRQLEERLVQASTPEPGGGAVCKKPASGPVATTNPAKANLAHLDVIVGAFACDITRVAAVQFGSDQTMAVDIPEIGLKGDQHGGFIHSGAPSFKNLTMLEKWFSERFAELIGKLKAIPEADGSGSLFDNTLIVWARDMGDSVSHNQKSMRFVLAGGAGGYLKTHPNGRYLNGVGDGKANRHERLLLNVCEAMGVTSFAGFGDPKLAAADKVPIPAISG